MQLPSFQRMEPTPTERAGMRVERLQAAAFCKFQEGSKIKKILVCEIRSNGLTYLKQKTCPQSIAWGAFTPAPYPSRQTSQVELVLTTSMAGLVTRQRVRERTVTIQSEELLGAAGSACRV